MKGQRKKESDVITEIRLAFSKLGIPLWRNHVALSRQESGHNARSGLAVGSADLIGLVPPTGVFVAIECKRPKGGRTTKRQADWLEVVRRCGGVAGVARSVEEALAIVAPLRSTSEKRS